MTESKTKVTLLVLTLNEIEGMKAIMPLIDRAWVDQVIVVDGGSTDGTIEWAEKNGYEVFIQQRRGFRHAYHEVWSKISGEAVITFSPDGNSIPGLIPVLVDEYRRGNDMVIASRYKEDAVSEDDDWMTAFGNWIFTKLINLFHGGSYTDAMVIFRIYSTSLPDRLGLHEDRAYSWMEKVFNTNISWEPLMSIRAARLGFKIAEIPGSEPPRIGGERKLRPFRWGAAYLCQIFLDRTLKKGLPRS